MRDPTKRRGRRECVWGRSMESCPPDVGRRREGMAPGRIDARRNPLPPSSKTFPFSPITHIRFDSLAKSIPAKIIIATVLSFWFGLGPYVTPYGPDSRTHGNLRRGD